MIKNKIGLFKVFFIYFFLIAALFSINLFFIDLVKNNNYFKIASILLFFIFTFIFFKIIWKYLSFNFNKSDIEEQSQENSTNDNPEGQLKDSGSRLFNYDAILNTADTFILVVDSNLSPVYINEFGKEKLGELYHEDNLKLDDFVEETFIKELNFNMGQISKTFYLETKIKVANKRTITTSVFISKLFDKVDLFSGMVIVFNDISKQKRAELSLNNQINFSKQIFKTIPDVILITDMDLRVIFANKKAEAILAKNKDENRKIFNYLSQKSIENGFDEYLRQIINKGITDKQINVQNPFISEAGFVDIEIVPLMSNNKTIGGLLLVKDITEWRNLTEELKNLENFNRKMINSSPYVIISINEEDIVTGWNERGEEKFGIKANEIIGNKLFEICPPLEIIRDEVNEAKIVGEMTFLSERKIEFIDKKKNDVEVTIYPVYSKENNVVINIRDVSEIKKLESSLVQAQKMGSLGLLTSKVVHDLNNVLSGITGYATLLDKKVESDSDVRKYIDRLITSSERAVGIIKQTLSFSKVNVKKQELININELINESAKLLKLRIGSSKVSLDLAEENLMVLGSKTRFSQAIMNLLINANDALMDVEKPEMEITSSINYRKEDPDLNNIIISIRDNGQGIKEEDIKKIFDPYFTTKTENEGTGLGLSNVKDIITELDGTIIVRSEYGHGTEFILTLPEAKGEQEMQYSEEKELHENIKLNIKGKILLVDDEETVREIGKEILALLDLDCITAIDGEDGIVKFEENKDDIKFVILDVEMPKKQGNEVFDFIKKVKPDVKILIASGYPKDYLEKNIFQKNIPDYIAKPFQLKELSEKISKMVNN